MSSSPAIAAPLVAATPSARPRKGYWAGVIRRLGRDPVTIVCGSILMLMLIAMMLAPWIAPHDPYQTSIARRLRPVGFPRNVPAPTNSAATC
jgi:peptide/nickel transport system permease protein